MTVRRGCKNWLLVHPSPLVGSITDWRDRLKPFGFGNEKRKQGDEHSLRGLAGAFATSINVIIVTTSGHHTVQYYPPDRPHSQVIWLIYLDLEHNRHYLSTTQNLNTTRRIITPSTGGGIGISTGTRRATGSPEPTNDPTPAVVSNPRIPVPVLSTQTSSNSQGTSYDPETISEDIFANMQYVQVDFVHYLIQNGALNFIQRIYKEGTLWTPRDCRIQRTSPNGESYKEFTKCLTFIVTVAKSYPVKTLQRELLTFVAKQLPFFIFPPTDPCAPQKAKSFD